MLKALRTVFPHKVPLIPVGGIDESSFAGWVRAGAAGFGIGSALYRPGDAPALLRERAQRLFAALHRTLEH